MVEKKIIDLETFPRKEHFNRFIEYQNPHTCMTVEVDVTELSKFCKDKGVSFYLTFMHVIALAANKVEQFRQRIDGDDIVEYCFCNTSHVESVGDGTYCNCNLNQDLPFDEYIRQAEIERIKYRENPTVDEVEDWLGRFFISSVPWFSYLEAMQPLPNNRDTNPRFTWGKYKEDFRGRLVCPLTIITHHALVDGLHIAKFLENLDKEISDLC